MYRHLVAIAVFFALSRIAFACQAPDSIAPVVSTVQEAKEKYKRAISDGSTAMVGQMDKKIQELADMGNLKGVKLLLAEKKAFEELATLPTSPTFKTEVEAFKALSSKASSELIKAYKEAIKQQTKLLNIDEAEALSKEMEELVILGLPEKLTKSNESGIGYELKIEAAKKNFLDDIATARAAYEKQLSEAEATLEKVFDDEMKKQSDKGIGKKIQIQKEQYMLEKSSKNLKPIPETKEEFLNEIIATINSGTWYQNWEPGTALGRSFNFKVNGRGIDEKNGLRIRPMFVVQQNDHYMILLNGQLKGFFGPTGRQAGYRH